MKRIYTLLCGFLLFAGLPTTTGATPPVQLNPTGTALDQGLWWLYHLRYDDARRLFDQYAHENPKDPTGYFYKTASDWWQLAQQFDRRLPEIEERLEKDYQDTMRVADALLESNPDDKTKALACLYSGGAQGLKGRWLVTQKQWVKAYFLGKNGHKMLKKALKYDPHLYDANLGLGIYDYYTAILPGIQGVLAALFIHGDRERGLKELQIAIDQGEHARVEGMMFLIEIYTWEEHTPQKALPIAQQLHQEFPKSPAMHLAEIIEYYELRQWAKLKPAAQDYLAKSEKEESYFPKEGVFPAWYCLGITALWGDHDLDTAERYMENILKDPEQTSRWVTFAMLRLGQISDLRGERGQAMAYYRQVLSRPDFWGSHRESSAGLKEPYK
jgi:hypothetical protein